MKQDRINYKKEIAILKERVRYFSNECDVLKGKYNLAIGSLINIEMIINNNKIDTDKFLWDITPPKVQP